MKTKIKLFLFVISLYSPCFSQRMMIDDLNVQKIISSTNIIRNSYPDTAVINLYQGNGKFGCSYGSLGLHNKPHQLEASKYGKTQYMHFGHKIRAKFGADYLIPLARIYWEEAPPKINKYEQYQSFYDGTLKTHFECDKNKTTVTTWFDPIEKDIAGIKINVEGCVSDILFEPFNDLKVHYDQNLAQESKVDHLSEKLWSVELTCLNDKSSIYLKTNASVEKQGTKLHIKLHPGENEILISVNQLTETTLTESLKRNITWWHSKWEHSGLLVLPDLNAQKMWVRSMAQFLSTYSNGKFGISPPMGFTGNGWPFNFPQDVSYIHPIFLATGNMDIVQSWIEYWAERLPGMTEYTSRLLNVKGVMCPWVFPYDNFKGYHDPIPPNKYYYEIHNSGYLARMAYETAVFLNDTNWTKEYAVPLIRETALFYESICHKRGDGYWHLSVKPSMGQDEMGGVNQDDYLCALFSAQYCFQKAVEYNLDLDSSYRAILSDGLAFPSLKSGKGFYFTCHGSGEADFGKQKHPVQLNDLAYLPINPSVTAPTSIAYNLRYEITEGAKRPFFHGWTLGEFLLAGSRIGDVEGWKKDWENLRKSDYIDPDWIQVYETSSAHEDSFYNTTNGLIAQSLLNNIVSDWFGDLEIAKCNPWKGAVLIKDIYSLLGIKINGEINENSAIIYLIAWKNCNFNLCNEKIAMLKNDKLEIKIDTKRRRIIYKKLL